MRRERRRIDDEAGGDMCVAPRFWLHEKGPHERAFRVLQVRWIAHAVKKADRFSFLPCAVAEPLFACVMRTVRMRAAWATVLLRFLLVGEQWG